MDPPSSGTEELQKHRNMADDDEEADARSEEDEQPMPGVKNEEDGTQPVANLPFSVVKIKDLEAGGPTFKDQFNHVLPSSAAAPAGGLLLNGVSISDVSESAVHIDSRNNKHHQHDQHHQHEIHDDGAPSLFQQAHEEPTVIPLVDNVAVLIPETQIRNERQIDDLQRRLAQSENELRAKQMKKKRTICYIVAGVVTLLGLLLGIFFGIVPISTRDTAVVGPPATSPTASLTATTATSAPTATVPPAYAGARAELIANLVNRKSLLSKAIPYPPSTTAATPQPDEQALEWLIRNDLQLINVVNDEDPLNMDEAYKAKLVQRFVLATFVFHLDTADQLQAAALGNQAWLGATDECTWAPITCTDGAHVDQIVLDGVKLQGSLPINISAVVVAAFAQFGKE
jgi:flagellar basal body-associated protein FliL